MKFLIVIIVLIFSSCIRQNKNLDYPKNINEISEVVLDRPDKSTNEESAEIKYLTKEETSQLLRALKKSKPVGPSKFKPDFYIIFKTKTNEIKKIKINGSIIKGYDSDNSYRIEKIKFLTDF
jgi:hypothetical protein